MRLGGTALVLGLLALVPERPLWADDSRVYRIGYGNDVPFHFQAGDGRPAGLAVEMVREAAERRSIRLEWVQAPSFAPKTMDFWVLMSHRADRTNGPQITSPYLQTHSCLVVPAASSFREVRDLRGRRISFLNYAIHRTRLRELLPDLQPVPATSSHAALGEVVAGRAEAAYLDEYAALPALLKGGFSTSLRMIPSRLPAATMGLASTREAQPIADQIRAELGRMADQGQMARIAETWSFFPNLTTDMLQGVASTQRRQRWLAGGVLTLGLMLVGAASLAQSSRRQTRRLQATQQQLIASQERWRAVVESEPECVLLMSPDGVIVEMNRAGLEMLQTSLSQVQGRNATEVVAEADRARFAELLTAVARGEQRRLIYDILGFHGRRLTMETVCVPLRDPADTTRIEYLVGVTRDITERMRAQETLARNEAELSAIHEHTPVMQCVLDGNLRIVRANAAMARFTGRSTRDLAGLAAGDILACLRGLDDPRGCGFGPACAECPTRKTVMEVMRTGEPVKRLEVRPRMVRGEGGSEVVALLSCSRLDLSERACVLLSFEDVTTHRRLEEQLRQAQKMEAVGQLAGGVAHDFNNILAAILMNLALLRNNPILDEPSRKGLRDLEADANRAAILTKRLLMFSRGSVLEMKVLDLSDAVDGLLNMLGRLLGEDMVLNFQRSDRVLPVEADAALLEQVLMNLVVNARDAMPRGGRITLSTALITVDADHVATHPQGRVGSYACVTVADTGCGMDEATVKRIFEPFFTTKDPGKGTGLGLAMVYGIVGQHRGWVEVASRPGAGTTFRLLLPLTGRLPSRPVAPEMPNPSRGDETILFVEDEQSVRTATAKGLRYLGYRVHEAANADEAIEVWDRNSHEIDLVLSDMVMPGTLSGLELVRLLQQRRPGLDCIICSGYSTELSEDGTPADGSFGHLPKPFTLEVLSGRIRQRLDRRPIGERPTLGERESTHRLGTLADFPGS
jgi:PAS domain S-box-containing protein